LLICTAGVMAGMRCSGAKQEHTTAPRRLQ